MPKVQLNANGLISREQVFADEWLVSKNATKAAIKAGYSAKTAGSFGAQLLKRVRIKRYIDTMESQRADKLGATHERVLQEIVNVALGDARSLVEHHVGCCRYCWGKDFQYQRTWAEIERDREEHIEMYQDTRPFDDKGGPGYNKTRKPNPDCQECFGIGEGYTVVKDTRDFDSAAVSMYAGVEQGLHGLKIKLNDKQKNLEILARKHGIIVDKSELTGKDGAPLIPEALSSNEIARRVAFLLTKAAKK